MCGGSVTFAKRFIGKKLSGPLPYSNGIPMLSPVVTHSGLWCAVYLHVAEGIRFWRSRQEEWCEVFEPARKPRKPEQTRNGLIMPYWAADGFHYAIIKPIALRTHSPNYFAECRGSNPTTQTLAAQTRQTTRCHPPGTAGLSRRQSIWFYLRSAHVMLRMALLRNPDLGYRFAVRHCLSTAPPSTRAHHRGDVTVTD